MPSLASISDPRLYHILTYGTLLGSNIQNTFLQGPIAYKCLPRAQFSTLQQNIFPPFFAFQSVLPLVLAFTWPGSARTSLRGPVAATDAGWRGLLVDRNFWTALVPIAAMFGSSFLNLTLLGPATTTVMKKRKHQGMLLTLRILQGECLRLMNDSLETRDGKRYYDPGPKSAEMEKLNSSFMWLHSASSLANLVGLGAMVYYGIVLAEKI